MISYQTALQIIDSALVTTHIKKVKLKKALARVLAEDIEAPINLPSFKQSAMDGYAIILDKTSTYTLVNEVKAGDKKQLMLETGQAIRIFTGAQVPEQADTVVIQEHVSANNNQIIIEKMPELGANVRLIGEQVKQGDIVLKKGEVLNEASIGFLAGLGITKVAIYLPPKISILVTGNELQKPGKPLKPGAIYESNAIMLRTALKRFGIPKVNLFYAKDTLKSTKKKIKQALTDADILLISGGISVGDYDFVKEALQLNMVDELFYKINQKPGKPLWFGKKDHQFVFALPGNPASALTCFYVYVLPLIKKCSGFSATHLPRIQALSASKLKNKTEKTLFLKAFYETDTIHILDGQQSSMLHSFASSNALAIIPEDIKSVSKNDTMTYIKLDAYGN